MEATADPNLKALPDAYRGSEANSFSLVLGGPLLGNAHLERNAVELLGRQTSASVLLTRVPSLVLSLLRMVLNLARP